MKYSKKNDDIVNRTLGKYMGYIIAENGEIYHGAFNAPLKFTESIDAVLPVLKKAEAGHVSFMVNKDSQRFVAYQTYNLLMGMNLVKPD